MSSRAPAATLSALVAARLLDAPLAGLAWLLVERGVPVVVAGRESAVVDALLDALVAALPPDRRPDPVVGLAGNRLVGLAGNRLVRVAGCLDTDTPPGILRAALAATTGRSGLALAITANDLAGVLSVLRSQGLTDDEISFMGVVLVLGRRDAGAAGDRQPDGASDGGDAARLGASDGGDAARLGASDGGDAARLVAAHYLRPVVLDAGGHPRRLAPAILATWDPAAVAWDDFSWGITPDLAERTRMRAGDLERERERRAALIAAHAHGGSGHADHALAGHAPDRPVG
jgi:hypothetical protein